MMGAPDEEIIKLYAPRGNYTKIQTTYSTRIETPRCVLCFGANYTGQGLLKVIHNIRSQVQRRAKEGLIERVDWVPRFSRTARWRRRASACEIDLSSAYASAALKIGAIDRKMYDRLMLYHKKTRLVAVGSLGTKRLVSTFKKGKLKTSATEVEETRWVWDSIVAEVDRTMCRLMETAGADFLHYWTDAIFVKKGAEARIQAKARKLGYGTKKTYVLASRTELAMVAEIRGSRRNFPVMGNLRSLGQ